MHTPTRVVLLCIVLASSSYDLELLWILARVVFPIEYSTLAITMHTSKYTCMYVVMMYA